MNKAVLYDQFSILKHLSFSRILNLIKLRLSYYLAKILKKNTFSTSPFSISIEPTTACNLGCPECPSGLKQFTRATGKINLELNEKILQELSPKLFYINYYFQGEPFLNPHFIDLVKQAKQHKIYVATSTNAHFIDENKAVEIINSGLDRLIISIDGTTQETYENYRVHGELKKVLNASKLLVQKKKELKSSTPHLIFQFLVVKPNEHQIKDVFSIAKEIGIDEVKLKSAQVYEYKNGNPLIPENEKYARYIKKKDGSYKLKAETGNHCWRMWSSCVFTWDGKVVPCCFDKDAKYTFGDIKKTKFKEIWKNDNYNAFRKQLLNDRSKIDICKNCSEGSKVWL